MTYRDMLLSEAKDTINGPRDTEYGDAVLNFQTIAKMWEPIFGTDISADQVALAMAALKIVRLSNDPSHRDSWVDLAGYAALGFEANTRLRLAEESVDWRTSGE